MSDHSPTPEEPTFLPPQPIPTTPALNVSSLPPAPASSGTTAIPSTSRRLIIVILVVLLVVIAALLLVNLRGSSTPGAGPSPTAAATVSPIPPNANADQSGILATPGVPATAPLLIIYQDYQCPWCALFDKSFKSVVDKAVSAGKVRVEYRTMIFLDQMLNNDSSMRAGIAAACSDGAGVYAAFHDAIYANQPTTEGAGYPDALLRDQLPATLGVTGDRLTVFQQCYDTKATQAFIQGTNDKALAAGIQGTPTYILNGQVITNQIDYQNPQTLATLLGVS